MDPHQLKVKIRSALEALQFPPWPEFEFNRHGDNYRTEDFYGKLFRLAFPAVLEEAPPDVYFGPRDQVMMCHGLRTFARFSVLFGLAETRPDPGGKRLSRIEFRKTTALDDFVRFDV